MKCKICNADVEKRYRYCSNDCRAKGNKQYAKIVADPERYEKRLARDAKYRKVVRAWLADYKIKSGCVDCGFNQHPAALELDHEGTKSFAIADIRSSIARLEKEILDGKCVVRCANCHAIKTSEERLLGTVNHREDKK